MIEQKKRKTPKRMKEESSYDPRRLGFVLEKEMGDMTRADFARKLGITRPTLDKYLSAVKGGVAPSCEALCLMADNLGCSVDYLLGRTRARNPEKAPAVDQLCFSEKVITSLMEHLKSLDHRYYFMCQALLVQPWFWNVVCATNNLAEIKANAGVEKKDTPFPYSFETREIDGRLVICYPADEACSGLRYYISEYFSRGIDELTDALITTDKDTNTHRLAYDKFLY